MSIQDTVKQMMSGESAAAPAEPAAIPNPVLGHVMELVNNPETGGLTGLMAKFRG